jgi:hypothetical protein
MASGQSNAIKNLLNSSYFNGEINKPQIRFDYKQFVEKTEIIKCKPRVIDDWPEASRRMAFL